MEHELSFEVFYHFENVPTFMQKIMQEEFMKHRNEVVDVFNERIDEVNDQWHQTGKPAAFGDYVEDINPEYAKFIKTEIQPSIDVLNKHFQICKYRIDEIGDIVGYLPWVKNSKIYITIKEIK